MADLLKNKTAIIYGGGGGIGGGVARTFGREGASVFLVGRTRAKLDAVERLGGEIISVPHEIWWQTMVDRRYEGIDGLFVHPVEDDAVLAGNGTIGLELVEDLPAFDADPKVLDLKISHRSCQFTRGFRIQSEFSPPHGCRR